MRRFFCIGSLGLLVLTGAAVRSEEAGPLQAVGVKKGDQWLPPEGEVLPALLLTPKWEKAVYLTDSKGAVVKQWQSSYFPASAARRLENGDVLRLGAGKRGKAFVNSALRGGQIEILGPDGTAKWSFWDAVSDHMACWDATVLDDGDILTAVAEWRSREECEALGLPVEGDDESGMIVPGLIRFRPRTATAAIPVWRWSLWDQLVQRRHPALQNYHFPDLPPHAVDIAQAEKFGRRPFFEVNSIDVHSTEKWVAITTRPAGELWIVSLEHSDPDEPTQRFFRFFSSDPSADSGSAVLSAEWDSIHGDESPRLNIIAVRKESDREKHLIQAHFNEASGSLEAVSGQPMKKEPEDRFLMWGADRYFWAGEGRESFLVGFSSLLGRMFVTGANAADPNSSVRDGVYQSLLAMRQIYRYPSGRRPGDECCGNAQEAGDGGHAELDGPPEATMASSLIGIRPVY